MESKPFKLVSPFVPTGDQPEAIEKIIEGVEEGKPVQVILGATGTGKTFTDANIIARLNRPTLVIVHNKTLASQLYGEFKNLFPENRVEYFISNFDFYQPEAYIPKTDTYIDKNAVMNEEIDMMRTSAMNSVLSRRDTIVVASVAAIYGLSDPAEYKGLIFEIRQGETLDRKDLFRHLVDAQYVRNNLELKPGTFRVHGDVIDIAPATRDFYIRVDCFGDEVENIYHVDTLTGTILKSFSSYPIYPAYDHASTRKRIEEATISIKEELENRLKELRSAGKLLEAERLELRTRQDIESMLEFGRCPGIENYSRHIDKRKEGQRPFTLMDYLPDDYLLLIDESHATFPQIKGMYNGDRSRKEVLVEYGFRLPSALDNRPLNFQEFESLMAKNTICTSATPGDYELSRANNEVVEQIIRPTGLLDPVVEVRPQKDQVFDLMEQIKKVTERNERALVITLTVNMAEDLSKFLKEHGIKVNYLHHETKTLERNEVIYQLRKGKFDVLVGINLLREGLDIPEVSLIAILDADKEGFLRSTRSLIQIIGRAARNVNGKVIMYAENVSRSMQEAIDETSRRREIQSRYNEENGIVPQTVFREIREPVHLISKEKGDIGYDKKEHYSVKELQRIATDLENQMKKAAKGYDFERAAELRDLLFEIRAEINK